MGVYLQLVVAKEECDKLPASAREDYEVGVSGLGDAGVDLAMPRARNLAARASTRGLCNEQSQQEGEPDQQQQDQTVQQDRAVWHHLMKPSFFGSYLRGSPPRARLRHR